MAELNNRPPPGRTALDGGQERPEVLYLTHHLPWPQRSGGRLREAQLLGRLAHRFAIEIVAISKTPERDRSAVGLAQASGIEAHIFAAERGPWLAGPLAGQHGSRAARAYLARRLRSPRRLAHVEGHYLFHLLPTFARSRAIIVEHNVESFLLRQAAAAEPSLTGRMRLASQAWRTSRTERAVWRDARLVGAVTADDTNTISQATPRTDVRLLPNGCDHIERATRPASSVRGTRLVFVGNYSYSPNADAASVLVTEVFPAIARQHPSAKLTMVGAEPPPWLERVSQTDSRITVTGWVPDLVAILDSADVVVCPLRIGGGVKVKILEALQRGKAVVTTPVGAQGLDPYGDCPVIVGDSPDALANACVRLLASERARHDQEHLALAAARSLPTWDEAAGALAACWTTTLASPAGGDHARRGLFREA